MLSVLGVPFTFLLHAVGAWPEGLTAINCCFVSSNFRNGRGTLWAHHLQPCVLRLSLCSVCLLGLWSRGYRRKTSIHVVCERAIGAKNPDKEFRNPDDLAIKFLGPRERALLPEFPMDVLDLDFETAMRRNPARAWSGRCSLARGTSTRCFWKNWRTARGRLSSWEQGSTAVPMASKIA